jgi:hypothetical protein
LLFQDYFGPNNVADYRKIEAAFQERGKVDHLVGCLLVKLTPCILDMHLKKMTDDLLRISGDMNRMRDDMMQLWKYAKDKKVTE